MTGLAAVLLRYPLITAKVIGAIHWEALKLWLKGAPLHSQPPTTRNRPVKEWRSP